MPLPKPTSTETPQEFLDRCMADSKTNEEFPDNDQRFAVCNGQLKKRDIELLEVLKAYRQDLKKVK